LIERPPRLAGPTRWGPDVSGRVQVVAPGGGHRGGVVVGSTNARGEEPGDRPIRPGDVLATVYRHLGIDPDQELPDRSGRPVKVLANGDAIRELI